MLVGPMRIEERPAQSILGNAFGLRAQQQHAYHAPKPLGVAVHHLIQVSSLEALDDASQYLELSRARGEVSNLAVGDICECRSA